MSAKYQCGCTFEHDKHIGATDWATREAVIVHECKHHAWQRKEIEYLRAEVERLKAALTQIIYAVPAQQDGGGFVIDRHSLDGEYIGTENVDPMMIIQEMHSIADSALAAAPQPPTVQAVTAAEVFAAFDEVSAAHETEKWTGDFVDNSTDGRRRRHEAWNRVNELRAKLTQQPTAEPKEKPAAADGVSQ